MDGVLTCDPNINANAIPVPYLTFDEAAELAYFGAQVVFVVYYHFVNRIVDDCQLHQKSQPRGF